MENDHLLHAYLNGTATAEDVKRLKTVAENADYIKIAEAAKGLRAPEFDEKTVFESIQEKIGNTSKVKQLNPWTAVLKIAAVFAVVFAGYLYVDSLGTTVKTSIAEKQNLVLPDGSEVALNAGSSIEYKKNNWDENRQLELTGEAYFKVTKGSHFEVKTATGTVTVLGTQFNVFARDGDLNVNCYEGLVSVAINDTLIKLPGGSGLKLTDGKLISKTKNPIAAPSWINNESSFENATLANVLLELQRQYPIKIEAPDKVMHKRFSGSFAHNDLNLALQLICSPLNLTYVIKKDQVTLYAAQDN